MILLRLITILTIGAILAILHGIVLGGDAWESNTVGGISIEEVLAMEEPLWVDVRAREAYDLGHYPGAHFLSEDDWDQGLGEILVVWEPDQPIIVYCEGGGCQASKSVASRLRQEFGMDTIFWLIGGWTELEEGLQP